MVFLLFHLGKDRYVLEASKVIEVLPLLELKGLPGATPGVAGMFNYHGRAVPVIDLSQMLLGRASAHRMSTRIILMNYPDEAGRMHPLGLIAEHATEVIRRSDRDFVESGLDVGGAPCLGPVLMDNQGVIQWVNEQRLLPAGVRDLLFDKAVEEAAHD